MGQMRNAYKILDIKSEAHSDDQGINGEDNIKMDLRKISLEGCGLGSSGSGQGSVAGSCEILTFVFHKRRGNS
jgi:hypothetical protein